MPHPPWLLTLPWDAGPSTDPSTPESRKTCRGPPAGPGGAGCRPGCLVPTPMVRSGGGGHFGLMSAGQGLLKDLHASVSPEPPAGHLG